MTTLASTELVSDGSSGKRWRVQPAPGLDGFADAPWMPLISTLLALRGVHTTAEAQAYLGAPGELTDPALMPNLDTAVARLAAACQRGERVAVFGDFDVDGITSTTIL